MYRTEREICFAECVCVHDRSNARVPPHSLFVYLQIIKEAPDYLDGRLVQTYMAMVLHGLHHCHSNFIIHRVRA